MVQRIKDIVWSAVIASVLTIIVVTALGWLTTQEVVEKARQEGGKELVALRASICLVRFQQRRLMHEDPVALHAVVSVRQLC